jgi:hypothetical protein
MTFASCVAITIYGKLECRVSGFFGNDLLQFKEREIFTGHLKIFSFRPVILNISDTTKTTKQKHCQLGSLSITYIRFIWVLKFGCMEEEGVFN